MHTFACHSFNCHVTVTDCCACGSPPSPRCYDFAVTLAIKQLQSVATSHVFSVLFVAMPDRGNAVIKRLQEWVHTKISPNRKAERRMDKLFKMQIHFVCGIRRYQKIATRPHLIVLLEESVLKCEAGNSATGQSGNQVDPNLRSAQNMRFAWHHNSKIPGGMIQRQTPQQECERG